MLELPCGFPVRFVGLIDLHVCDSESDEGENDRKDGQQDADLIEVAVDSLRPPVCGFLFRLVSHAVVRAADAVQPFLFSSFLFINRYCNPKGNDCNEHVPSVP